MQHFYVLVRRDLPDPGQLAVQAVHAAVEAARTGLIPADIPHPHLVLLGVADETELRAAAALLGELGVRFGLFTEPDLRDTATALCTAPLSRAALPRPLRKLLRSYPLLDPAARRSTPNPQD